MEVKGGDVAESKVSARVASSAMFFGVRVMHSAGKLWRRVSRAGAGCGPRTTHNKRAAHDVDRLVRVFRDVARARGRVGQARDLMVRSMCARIAKTVGSKE